MSRGSAMRTVNLKTSRRLRQTEKMFESFGMPSQTKWVPVYLRRGPKPLSLIAPPKTSDDALGPTTSLGR